jgi:hypothetical protein
MIKEVFQKKFLKELFISSILVLFLHCSALKYSLYWTIDWFDIPMHFLGGATMAFLALFIFFTSGYFRKTVEIKNNKIAVFLIVVLFTLVVGLVWELWEIFVGFSDVLTDKTDTIIDLIMDTIGAFSVFYYSKNKDPGRWPIHL